MNHFHTLKVKDIRKETNQAVSIAFELPADLKNTFAFESGQYVTVKKVVDGEDIRRSYSICSTPFEEEIRIGVKKIDNGKMSGFLNDLLTVGDELEVMPPAGNFTAKNHAGNIVGVAAGSGITPVFSLLKSVIKAGGKLTLFYGNINEASTIFKKELDTLAANHPNNFVVHYTYDEGAVSQLDPIQCGRID
ncbi:MAG: FAD-binding oxidoreductase, partial [Flavobacteriales bacterium]|nr:FAD-binding oxidoreductase [Flavobacteriales bacterium]